MAYSPVGHGRGVLNNPVLCKIAKSHEATSPQIALGRVLRQPGVIAIPKSSNQKHVRDNAHSLEVELTKRDLANLDGEFPPRRSKHPLPVL